MDYSNHLDEHFIEEVVSSNNIVDIISSYVQLKKMGNNYKGLCPFHNEKTPSFVVNEDKQIFKCFGCGEGGNAIGFLMKKENMTFTEALKNLCERANITYPTTKYSDEHKKNFTKKKRIYQLHKDLARYYFSNMQKNLDNSMQYLQNRGINEKTIKNFGLGYETKNSDSVNYLLDLGYTKDELIESQVFREKNNRIYSIFFSRIIFPIIDASNRVIAFGGRSMGDSMPKYLNSPESIIFKKKNELYGLNLAKKYNSTRIILVEGYMDVIRLNQNGIVGAIASLGTSLTKEQSELIKKQNKTVYICYDSDFAGINATIRAIDILKEQNIAPYIITLEDAKDPDEFFNRHKPIDFFKCIEKSVSPLTFSIDTLAKNYNFDIHSQKLEFLDRACDLLVKSDSELEKEYQIKRLSALTDFSIKAIGVKVYGEYFSPKRFNIDNKYSTSSSSKILNKPNFLITNPNYNRLKEILINNNSLIVFVIPILDAEELYDSEIKQLYTKSNEYNDITFKEEDVLLTKKLAFSIKYEIFQKKIKEIEDSIKNEKDSSNIIELSNKKIDFIKKMGEIKEFLKLNV